MTGRTFRFELNRTSTASPSTLFRLETDGAHWSDWGKPLVWQSSWEATGAPDEAGPGAIRKVGTWPLVVRERTVDYQPDRLHSYSLIGNPLIEDYLATATFTPNPSGGTDVRWAVSFVEGVPRTGPATAFFLRSMLKLMVTRLIRAAERAG